MTNTPRRICAFFLLATLLATFLYAPVLHWRQQSLRREMKERLEEELTCTLTLRPGAFVWAKKDREILVGDRLFDVKSFRHDPDGTLRCTGLFDEKEKALIDQLKHHPPGRSEQRWAGLFLVLIGFPVRTAHCTPSVTGVKNNIPAGATALCHTYIERPALPPWT